MGLVKSNLHSIKKDEAEPFFSVPTGTSYIKAEETANFFFKWDDGNIILQGALDFELNDNTHTAGCKCVDLGAKLMIRAITRYLENKDSLPSVKQDLTKGRVYYKKHFSDESIIRVRENLSNGVVAKFLENPKRCDIVSW